MAVFVLVELMDVVGNAAAFVVDGLRVGLCLEITTVVGIGGTGVIRSIER